MTDRCEGKKENNSVRVGHLWVRLLVVLLDLKKLAKNLKVCPLSKRKDDPLIPAGPALGNQSHRQRNPRGKPLPILKTRNKNQIFLRRISNRSAQKERLLDKRWRIQGSLAKTTNEVRHEAFGSWRWVAWQNVPDVCSDGDLMWATPTISHSFLTLSTGKDARLVFRMSL